ncbi:DMT family transporter [Thalassotalea castellviae]|uniref:DMT family transporter n=1 Tax=Thalassotalea castellviae TaxID=3075612 RepID=A0ABU3A807_9GAMM|nr:DMT family transporter [Thalassotalea sp. W431]MDT0605233.1 DMT family transporter [Thalassotalea sp. W431]
MIIRPTIELPLLAAIWGASFLFMKIGGPEFGPILFMAMRTFVASLLLVSLLAYKKQIRLLFQQKTAIFIVGLLNTAIPFSLFGWATLTLSAGSTSVLNATTPMFGAIVAVIWLKDTFNNSTILGLLIGFIGVYFLMFEKLNMPNSEVILPVFAVMLASLFYGISANFTKKYLSKVKPLVLATGSQISASLVLVPISLFFIPDTMPSIAAINAVVVLGIVCTGFAYIIFFRLISALGPTKAISVTYLIPTFGLLWGWIFLQENISMMMLFGCSLILFGVALTTGIFSLKNKLSITVSK